jgi:hypothetical protein
MARNLRAKLPAEDTLFIQDVHTAATKKFLEENPQEVRIADNVREVAEKSVCKSLSVSFFYMMNICSIHDLSWEPFVTLVLITP